MTATSRPYHHGDLRAALVEEALALARTEGPAGVSLREATRRVGVTPSAAYRHFQGRSHLLEAVARVIQERMAERMHGRMRAPQDAAPRERALQQLHGVGLGYIAFAREEPGWFETAFFGGRDGPVAADGMPAQDGSGAGAPGEGAPGEGAPGEGAPGGAGASDGQAVPVETAGQAVPDETAGQAAPPPFVLLVDALDECVRTGALTPERRPGAEFVCWSAVHGCAELVLHGPLRGAPDALVQQIAERVVADIITGLR